LSELKPSHLILIVLISFITAISVYINDAITNFLLSTKTSITSDEAINWYLRYLIWILYAVVFIFISACIGEYISRDAEGAGFSEVKAILGGLSMPNFLAPRTFVGKFIGMITVPVAGLSIGKAGPYVHLALVI